MSSRFARSLQLVALCTIGLGSAGRAFCQTEQSPSPLLAAGTPVNWWFAFKFNAETFPRPASSKPSCLFGGQPGGDKKYSLIGQDYVYASSNNPTLAKGAGYLGDSTSDPVGATFNEVYSGNLFYVVWNDQFYRDPVLSCEGTDATECGAKWAHSKGVLAWDANGNGFILEVTTPSWPGAGSNKHPRAQDGNSLGCVDDDDVEMSQDFFALKLTKADLLKVLAALAEEGAVTDTSLPQIVYSGGPQDVTEAVAKLGSENTQATFTNDTLSSGVRIIAKAGGLSVPPWQMVSAVLGATPLRVATFWVDTVIDSTTAQTPVSCWSKTLSPPGAVQIATTGTWNGTTIGLTGTDQTESGKSLGANHAKVGVSTSQGSALTIFGDMNQDGALSPQGKVTCTNSQNARGGLFFVVENTELHDSVAALLSGESAPVAGQATTTSKPKGNADSTKPTKPK